jgi:hypothetical protein
MLHGFWLSWHSLGRVFIVAIARVLATPTALRPWLRRLLVLRLPLRRRLVLRLLLVLRLALRLRRRLVLRLLLVLRGLLVLLPPLRLPLGSLLVSVLVVPPALMILIVVVGQCLAGSEAKQEDGARQKAGNGIVHSSSSNSAVGDHQSLLIGTGLHGRMGLVTSAGERAAEAIDRRFVLPPPWFRRTVRAGRRR